MAITGTWTLTAHAGWEALSLAVTGGGSFVDVYRIDIATGTETLVRDAQRTALLAGQWLGNDAEMRLGRGYQYRADVFNAATDPAPAATVVSGTRTMAAPGYGRPYLHAVLAPDDPLMVPWVEGADAKARESQSGTYAVVGRPGPVVVTAARSLSTGSVSLLTQFNADRDAMWALLETGQVLLLRTDDTFGVGNLYFTAGTVSEERLTTLGSYTGRRFTIEYTEVDPPGGPAGGVYNTWGTVLDRADTWAEVQTDRTTWRLLYTQPLTG